MGLHMAVGVLGTENRSRIPQGARAGFIVGSMLPDLDFVMLISVYPFDRDLALSLHRSFTHSLLLVAVIALVALLLRSTHRHAATALAGCALGMFVHDVLDVFMWFAPVGLLWPFGPPLNVVDGTRVPDLFWNLSFALEPAAYAVFLSLLKRRVGGAASGWLSVFVIVLLISSAGILPAGIAMTRREFEAIAYGVAILIGFLPSIYFLYRSRYQLLGAQAHDAN